MAGRSNLSEIRTEFDYFPERWDDRNSFGNGAKTHDRIVAGGVRYH